MRRKDCDHLHPMAPPTSARPPALIVRLGVSSALLLCALLGDALGGTVRVWPSAVVLGDVARLGDLCELTGFDPRTERSLGELVVIESPRPGGSRLVHMDMIRSALAQHGANLAEVTIRGAVRCAVSRPAAAVPQRSDSIATSGAGTTHTRNVRLDDVAAATPKSGLATLGQAVRDYFDVELTRFGGRADVLFDRTSPQGLDLSGPAYEFRVRRRGGSVLGLIQVDVDVLSEGRTVQVVPLVARVSLIRRVVVARRAVNQGATIRASDVELMPLSFTRVDALGIRDMAQVIGQRAKRFIAAGSRIEPVLLEQVPLVTRGQLVTLSSVVGAVRVVTTAKAMKSGLLGETIPVRAVDQKKVEYDAVVVGPGVVRIGAVLSTSLTASVAMGGGS